MHYIGRDHLDGRLGYIQLYGSTGQSYAGLACRSL